MHRRKNKFFWYIVLALFVLVSVFIVQYRLTIARGQISNGNQPIAEANNPETNSNIATNNIAKESVTTSLEVVNYNSNKDSTANKTTSKIPILMYHHIRNYINPEDKVGTNLSVSIQDFAAQLDLIKSRGFTTITFNDVDAGNIPEKAIILTFDDGYSNFYENAYPELKKRDMEAVAYIISNFIGKDGYMTTDQILEIDKSGIEIGDHTLSHSDLSKISAEKEKNEVERSKVILEEILNKKLASFCYPSGKYNSEVMKIVESAEFKYAVTTKPGISNFVSAFDLNRYRVNNNTSIKSYLK